MSLDDVRAGVRPGEYIPLPQDGRRLGSFVYEVVRERLLEGYWRAGEQIGVEQLKAELKVSKQPVMEALRRLAGDGLVEIRAQVGCRVPIYSRENVADFFTIFGGLEGASAGLAAQRCTPAQIAQLREINKVIGALDSEQDATKRSHGYRTLNRQFHTVLLKMAYSDIVFSISGRMWDMSDLLINTTGISQPLADQVGDRHADHERIIEALRLRDTESARREMEAHILRNIELPSE